MGGLAELHPGRVSHGGVGAAVAGRVPWQKGDRLSFTVSNDQAGKFHDFFRRRYGVQLPSVVSGTHFGFPTLLGLELGGTVTVTEGILDSLVS